MNMCGEQRADQTPEGRAETLGQASMSCHALAEQMGPSEWLCTAEGAISYGYSYGVKYTQDIYQLGNGKTRSAAVSNAIGTCNSFMTEHLAIQGTSSDASTQWEAETTSQCHITRCIPPAPARKTRQR